MPVIDCYSLTFLTIRMSLSTRTWTSSNCNCNWGTCIVPPTRRLRATHRVNPYLGAHRQNETKTYSDHDKTSPSIAAVSAPSVACSMLAVQQQKRLCCQFVDVSVCNTSICWPDYKNVPYVTSCTHVQNVNDHQWLALQKRWLTLTVTRAVRMESHLRICRTRKVCKHHARG